MEWQTVRMGKMNEIVQICAKLANFLVHQIKIRQEIYEYVLVKSIYVMDVTIVRMVMMRKIVLLQRNVIHGQNVNNYV